MNDVRDAIVYNGGFDVVELRDVAPDKLHGGHLVLRQERLQSPRLLVNIEDEGLMPPIDQFPYNPYSDESLGAGNEKALVGRLSRAVLIGLTHQLELYAEA